MRKYCHKLIKQPINCWQWCTVYFFKVTMLLCCKLWYIASLSKDLVGKQLWHSDGFTPNWVYWDYPLTSNKFKLILKFSLWVNVHLGSVGPPMRAFSVHFPPHFSPFSVPEVRLYGSCLVPRFFRNESHGPLWALYESLSGLFFSKRDQFRL